MPPSSPGPHTQNPQHKAKGFAMTFYPNQLSDDHRHQLKIESAIAPEITAERSVHTITRGRQLPKGFSQRQRRRTPGILFTSYRPNGETAYIFRPDRPDPKNPGHKYEQACKALGAPGNTLDIHPTCQHLIRNTSAPVVYVEGVKKADAITSAARAAGVEVLVVAISGVWNWMSGGEPIPDMLDIPVEGRRVTVCFDSDMLSNPTVQDAAQRLAEHLGKRGAEVYITFLPDQADGSKNGADDFLASGGTLAEMRLLTRRYDPADFERVRLSRDERLRLALEDLEHRFWNSEWKGQGGHTDRDVALKLIEAARRHGKVVEDGVRVVKSWGALELETKVSRRTLAKAINRLEERDFGYRDSEGRKPDKSGAFVLRAGVNQYGEEKRHGEEATQGLQGLYARGLHLRAPRLRWSSPQWKPSKQTIREARKGNRRAPLPEPRPAIKRLGKVRGSVLDALDAAGGTATLQELADLLHKKRARDLRRRTLPMLEEAGIVVVDGAAVTLAGDWLERLDQVRKADDELSADEVARVRLHTKRQAYRARHAPELHPDPAPTYEELARLEAARNVRRIRLAREALLAPNSGAAINLALLMNGELQNTDFLVRSVLYFHKAPAELLERWRGPVLEAAASIVRQLAAAPPAPVPSEASPPDDWRDHPLDCECTACLYPEPKYARPYAGSGAA
jgi:hypothetical protein